MHTVFYSWQSNLPEKGNRQFIQECMQDAITELSSDESYKIELALDRAALDEPGTPDILNSILSKISQSLLFVGDVSIINKEETNNKLKTPNPNVMFELGYAVSELGWENTLMVYNEWTGKYRSLPADFRHRLGISYFLEPSSSPAHYEAEKKKLTEEIKAKIILTKKETYKIQLRRMIGILSGDWVALGKNNFKENTIDINKTFGNVSIKHIKENMFDFRYTEKNGNGWGGKLSLNKDFLEMGRITWTLNKANGFGVKEIFLEENDSKYLIFINPINYVGPEYGSEVLCKNK